MLSLGRKVLGILLSISILTFYVPSVWADETLGTPDCHRSNQAETAPGGNLLSGLTDFAGSLLSGLSAIGGAVIGGAASVGGFALGFIGGAFDLIWPVIKFIFTETVRWGPAAVNLGYYSYLNGGFGGGLPAKVREYKKTKPEKVVPVQFEAYEAARQNLGYAEMARGMQELLNITPPPLDFRTTIQGSRVDGAFRYGASPENRSSSEAPGAIPLYKSPQFGVTATPGSNFQR